MLKYLPIFLVLIMVSGTAYAQVEVKQSVTTKETPICMGAQAFCTETNITTQHGGVIFTDLPGLVMIHYCHNDKCHAYYPYDNGTIRKVN